MKSTVLLVATLALLTFIVTPRSSVSAATIDEQTIDFQVRDVAKTLRCTICQNESIWESQAELARQMRTVIRERLVQGESPEQVRAYFQSRYGDYILLAPRRTGLNWILWAGPFVLLAVGSILLYRNLARWVGAKSEPTAVEEPGPPIDDAMRQRIEAEYRGRQD